MHDVGEENADNEGRTIDFRDCTGIIYQKKIPSIPAQYS